MSKTQTVKSQAELSAGDQEIKLVHSLILYGLIAIGLVVAFFLGKYLLGIVSIPDDSIGVVTKKFAFGKNSALPDGHVIALKGEAGTQADTLAPGLYFGYWGFMYSVKRTKFLEVPQGQVGIVEAIDGNPLDSGHVLADDFGSDNFQSARLFLENGGQRGTQLSILNPGVYRINPVLFTVALTPAIQIKQNEVGIVTTSEGQSLGEGEIAGPAIGGHRSFQNASAFVKNGGSKGLQESVVLAGTYYINPRFAQIKTVPMLQVPVGYVGVVTSYVGGKAVQDTASNFTQGMIVQEGQKGVWDKPLDPGLYPVNPNIMAVELVPTTNIVLNWANMKSEAHNLDKNLSPITVRSADGFTFNVDLQQIIHITRQNASKVIARFGSMENLVTQVLEPLIGNYFRNSAQTSDSIDFLRTRTMRQDESKKFIEASLQSYNVQAVDTLIGDITPPKELMKTLTDRKIAEQEQITYGTQETAQVARARVAEQTALADTKASVVTASRSVEIAEYNASATVKTAEGAKQSSVLKSEGDAEVRVNIANADAAVKRALASAEAEATKVTGEAEGSAKLAVGNAEAAVIKSKVEAMGQDNYARVQITDFISQSDIRLVPEISVGGGSGGSSGLMDALLGSMLSKQLKPEVIDITPAPQPPANTSIKAAE